MWSVICNLQETDHYFCFIVCEVVWFWWFEKSRPQLLFVKWSGLEEVWKTDHSNYLWSGLVLEIWKKQTTVIICEVVWFWRFGKSRPQLLFVMWSGIGDLEKADHSYYVWSGLVLEIWKKQTTVIVCEVVCNWRNGKSRPQLLCLKWSAIGEMRKADHKLK